MEKAKLEACVLDAISNADDDQMAAIIATVIKRYRKKYPDWEVCFLSYPRDDPGKMYRNSLL